MPSKYCFEFARSGECRFGERCRYPHIPLPDGSAATVTTVKVCTSIMLIENMLVTLCWQKKTKGKKSRKTTAAKSEPRHLADFFAQYPTFQYDSAQSPTDEFKRMRRQFGWEGPRNSSTQADTAWEGYRDALTLQFGGLYGTDVNDVKSWQHLCGVLKIDPVPADLETCREVCWSRLSQPFDLTSTPSL